jgi:hypothetical protein
MNRKEALENVRREIDSVCYGDNLVTSFDSRIEDALKAILAYLELIENEKKNENT